MAQLYRLLSLHSTKKLSFNLLTNDIKFGIIIIATENIKKKEFG